MLFVACSCIRLSALTALTEVKEKKLKYIRVRVGALHGQSVVAAKGLNCTAQGFKHIFYIFKTVV